MIKTIDIEIAILREFDHVRNIIVNGVTNASTLPIYFEADMLILTKSNYAHAVEIKISKSNLKNDLKKKHIKLLERNFYKYLDLYYGKLKHFSYAVPIELKESALEQIPDFCGLWVYEENTYPRPNRLICHRTPKQLSNYKWTDKERYELARLGTMRILGLKENIRSLDKRTEK